MSPVDDWDAQREIRLENREVALAAVANAPAVSEAEIDLNLRVTVRVSGEHMTAGELMTILCGDRHALIEVVARRVAAADFGRGVIPVGWADQDRAAFVDRVCAAQVIGVSEPTYVEART